MGFLVALMQTPEWEQYPDNAGSAWDRWQADLKHCARDRIVDLGRQHKSILKQKLENLSEEDKHAHAAQLRRLLGTLLMKWTIGSSMLFCKLVAHFPQLEIVPVRCNVPSEYVPHFTREIDEWRTRKKQYLLQRQDKYDAAQHKIGPGPEVKEMTILTEMRLLRLYSSYPIIISHPDFRDLSHTLKESTQENQWMCRKKGSYEMRRTDSPYEEHIPLFGHGSCSPKLQALAWYLTKHWPRTDKVVICTVGPISSLIMYWVSH